MGPFGSHDSTKLQLLIRQSGAQISLQKRLKLTIFIETQISHQASLVYRQLGDSDSQWHKKIAKSASLGKCLIGEVPVGGSASWGKCQLGVKNLTPFSALNEIHKNIKKIIL